MIDFGTIIDFNLLVLSAIILREYLNTFLNNKDVPIIRHIISWALYVCIHLNIDIFIQTNPYTTLLFNIGFVILISLAAYSGKFYKKVLYSLLYVAIWMLIEVLLNYVLVISGFEHKNYNLLASLLSKLFLFIIIKIIAEYAKVKLNIKFSFKYWIVLLMIPIFSIIVITSLFSLVNLDYNIHLAIVFLIIGSVMMFINFITFIVFDRLMNGMLFERQNSLYEQQLKLCSKQAAEREEAMLDIRKIRHDMKNHLIYLREMIDIDDKDRILIYIDNLIKDTNIEKFGISKSANIVIDALVNYKYSVAKRKDIDFNVNITVPYKLPYEDGDICIILGNALDNAIESTSLIMHDRKYINLTISSQKNILCFVIKNNYIKKPKKDKEDKYITTKKDKINHGLGLISIQKAVDKYSGELIVKDAGYEFTLTILLYSQERKTT